MAWVATGEFATHLGVGALPEAGEIGGDLDRTLVGCQQVQDQRDSPLADARAYHGAQIDYNVRAERMGWLPSAPQLKTNPMQVAKDAAAAGMDAKDYVVKSLKDGSSGVRFPDVRICMSYKGIDADVVLELDPGMHPGYAQESEARKMVDGWRRANPWSVPYWQSLEIAYTRAIRNPRTEFVAGRVTYYYDGEHLWYSLPSGRVLCYPFARIEEDGVTYAKASWKPAADAKEWPRARLWKGLACENITQATAADILRNALRHLPDVVLHVHDEIVIETDQPEDALEMMQRVMTTPPTWAKGLPLAAEASIMDRYGK